MFISRRKSLFFAGFPVTSASQVMSKLIDLPKNPWNLTLDLSPYPTQTFIQYPKIIVWRYGKTVGTRSCNISLSSILSSQGNHMTHHYHEEKKGHYVVWELVTPGSLTPLEWKERRTDPSARHVKSSSQSATSWRNAWITKPQEKLSCLAIPWKKSLVTLTDPLLHFYENVTCWTNSDTKTAHHLTKQTNNKW